MNRNDLRDPARRHALRTLSRGALAGAGAAAGWTASLRNALAQAPAATGAASAGASPAPRVARVASGLEHPWSLAFLPDGRTLVTERPGRLRVVSLEGRLSKPLDGVPEVFARGQGGLLDVVLAPDFDVSQALFLSYAEPVDGGARTAVARAEFVDGPTPALRATTRIWAQKDASTGGNHFGSRIVFARDGTMFVTMGDRFTHRDRVQQLDNHYGKIVRIRPDGSVPNDNPFRGREGALPDIYAYGVRNAQGAALNPATGELWIDEHGPQGGDEVNIVRAGANYGWPVITYGKEYVTGFTIGEGSERPDVAPPVWQWTPSIAPSGLAFYMGHRFPEWRGDAFVGSLKFRLLSRLSIADNRVVQEERLLQDLRQRVRDVRASRDGLLYLLTDEDDGSLLRLEPGAPS
ncbi:MAG: PQQ-dependent sugar dehydrogenase [Burkholderiaceae bacterium]|nr:PQQ-dependent sugar dehydrogenase [Burkholderiaceae bacterium]